MSWAGHVARMGEERLVYRVLVGKPEGRRPLGRPRHRWIDNIRMDVLEVGCGFMGWIGLVQDGDSVVSQSWDRIMQSERENFECVETLKN